MVVYCMYEAKDKPTPHMDARNSTGADLRPVSPYRVPPKVFVRCGCFLRDGIVPNPVPILVPCLRPKSRNSSGYEDGLATWESLGRRLQHLISHFFPPILLFHGSPKNLYFAVCAVITGSSDRVSADCDGLP